VSAEKNASSFGLTSPQNGQKPALVMVGAGQLARMCGEAASALAIDFSVLAENPDDPATQCASKVVLGKPDAAGLSSLLGVAPVVSFDHEQVDLDALVGLAQKGMAIHPGIHTLQMAVDKAMLRRRMAENNIPQPKFVIAQEESAAQRKNTIVSFAESVGWPIVVKPARGGYDGRGVYFFQSANELDAICEESAKKEIPLVVEERLPLDVELAVLIVRSPRGEMVHYPVIRTVQEDGICRETIVPAGISKEVEDRAQQIGEQVAAIVDATGILAVELFVTTDGVVLLNEIAARPHNSGHWSIEGAHTSQFENHLRAVLDLPLGACTQSAPVVVTVNVIGGEKDSADLTAALSVSRAHIHLYNKSYRRGRKLGHVTAIGDDVEEVRSRAWDSALALGTQPLVERESR